MKNIIHKGVDRSNAPISNVAFFLFLFRGVEDQFANQFFTKRIDHHKCKTDQD